MTARRGGPEPEPETAKTRLPTTVSDSIAPTTDSARGADPVDFLGIIAGAYAVAVKVDAEHHRRHLFMTLKPAERAAARARARGQAAEVVLVRLEAVGVVPTAVAEEAS